MKPQAMVLSKFKVSISLYGFAYLCQRVDQEVDRQGASEATDTIKTVSHFWHHLAYFLEEWNRRGVQVHLQSRVPVDCMGAAETGNSCTCY